MDAFTVAVLVPNLLGSLITGSAAAGLVPALIKAEAEGRQERSDTYRTSCFLLLVMSGIGTLALAAFPASVMHVVASAFDAQRFSIAVKLARWAAPLFLLNGLYGFASAELLARRKYAVVAAAPGISTLVSLALIAVFHHQGVGILIWSLLAGTALQAAIVMQPAWIATSGGRVNRWGDPHVKRVMASQLPLFAASSIGVANVFVDQSMAALLPAGNVSALNYATSLNTVMMQVVVMAMGWVALPEFSAMIAAADFGRLRQRVRFCIIAAAMLAVPACVGIALFGQQAIRIVFQHGMFHADSTALVYIAWAGYSLGLFPAAFGMIAVRVTNGLQDNWLLFRVSLVLLVMNGVLDYGLMRLVGIAGIALSTTLVYCISCALMYSILHRRGTELLDRRTLRRVGLVIAAAIAAAVPAGAIVVSFGTAIVPSAFALVLFMVILLVGYREAGLIALDLPPGSWQVWQYAHLCIDER